MKQAVAAAMLIAGCRFRPSPGGQGASATGVGSGSAVASAPASESASASELASASASAPASAPASELAPAPSFPFGHPTPVPHYTCPIVLRGGPFHRFMSSADTQVAFVDGDELLALVNRSPLGSLAPDYAPSDLVDLRDGSSRKARECDGGRICLRRAAADALKAMLDKMRTDGVEGHVASAYRGFGTQCWVFSSWAHQARGGYCEATEQSALPGHSQHQLGTTVDLFTRVWAVEGNISGRGVFRDGFGCSPGGRWIDDNAWTFGFVVSYPIDPDDRRDGSRCLPRVDHRVPIDPKTGYKSEPWHVRFVGADSAAAFHKAWIASGPGTPAEITLEQWIRAGRGLAGDTDLPVCDGCQCGACATLGQDDAAGPCGEQALRLDEQGRVRAATEEPRLVDAHVSSAEGGVVVEAVVEVGPHTPTQTPVTAADAPAYAEGSTFEALVPYADTRPHSYPDLRGAWRVAVEPVPQGSVGWPWRASLAKADLAVTWNRANLVLPAKSGEVHVQVRVAPPAGVRKLRVTLLRDGVEHEVREVDRP